MAAEGEASWALVWDQLKVLFGVYAEGLGPSLSPLNVLATLALCLGLWLVWKPSKGFLAWVFPAKVYRTRTFLLDLWLLLLNWFVGLFTALNYATIATVTAYALWGTLGLPAPPPEARNPVLSALVIFLAGDLALYWFHRLHHRRPALWAFHALHHSAEEMSPVTAYRHHPIYHILTGLFVSVAVGLCQGLAMVAIIGRLDVAVLAGTNVFSALLNLATNHLKHSHIQLRFPAWLEHVLISPAQHQVHHSIDPKHFNRNYGDSLAIWDWMFGTLYISRPGEEIRFGLGDATGTPLPQRHPNLRTALAEPMGRARAILLRRDGRPKKGL